MALAFLVLVGAALIAESLHREIPQGYVYLGRVFAAAVEWVNIRLRGPRPPAS
jgi:predicted tellurium resistance membrane protein TerC